MKLSELAGRLSCTLDGDGNLEIRGVAPIEDAAEGDITFLANRKYIQKLKDSHASAVIVSSDFAISGRNVLRSSNPYLTFAQAAALFHQPAAIQSGIHPTACISASARVSADASIGAFVYIGERAELGVGVRIGPRSTIQDDAVIGDGTVIYSGVVVRESVRIGKHCVIQDNAVIGSDGFGYARQDDGGWFPIVQAGTVVLEDYVDVGAGSTIDRASMGETRIGRGTKIDNLVHIGHACKIGEDCLICAQVGLAGTTTLGRNVILAGQVGAAGHLTLGDGVTATAQTGIPSSVEAGRHISGSPAMDHRTWLKTSALIEKLPELRKQIQELEARLRHLENTSNNPPETGK